MKLGQVIIRIIIKNYCQQMSPNPIPTGASPQTLMGSLALARGPISKGMEWKGKEGREGI